MAQALNLGSHPDSSSSPTCHTQFGPILKYIHTSTSFLKHRNPLPTRWLKNISQTTLSSAESPPKTSCPSQDNWMVPKSFTVHQAPHEVRAPRLVFSPPCTTLAASQFLKHAKHTSLEASALVFPRILHSLPLSSHRTFSVMPFLGMLSKDLILSLPCFCQCSPLLLPYYSDCTVCLSKTSIFPPF